MNRTELRELSRKAGKSPKYNKERRNYYKDREMARKCVILSAEARKKNRVKIKRIATNRLRKWKYEKWWREKQGN